RRQDVDDLSRTSPIFAVYHHKLLTLFRKCSVSIYIGLGANLTHPKFGSPTRTLAHALATLNDRGVRPVKLSNWYRTAPVPVSNQPWYFNAVAEVATGLGPD